jgi:hypothetical protein
MSAHLEPLAVTGDSAQPEERRARRRRRGHDPSRLRRHRLRLVYFILASVWGFMSGTVAVIVSLSLLGQPVELQVPVAIAIAAAAVLALVGGAVAARAYRETTQRGS